MLSQVGALTSLPDGACAVSGELFVFRQDGVYAAMFPAFPSGDDVEAFLKFFDHALTSRHRSLLDFSRLERVDQGAFGALLAAVEARRHILAHQIELQVLVHPKTIAGAFVAGFFSIFIPPYPAEVVSDPADAMRRLALDVALATIVDERRGALLKEPQWLRDMRRYFAANLASATLEDAARTLGFSTRTLQRQLQTVKRTFSQELDGVRLQAAEERLHNTQTKITAIAAELGFSSIEHFSEWFKRHHGEPPSVFRDKKA